MNAPAKIEVTGLDKLRLPFPPNQISKLPKETRRQIDERKNKVQGCMVWKCPDCGNAHHKDAVHLDYVGHAALTDRLLDTDPQWSWEPVAFNDTGLPAFDQSGGLWIKLTVCGVTRLGYGHAAAKPGVDPGAREKEVIGDALRNAAMRFGAALDLWHKGDLRVEDDTAVETTHDEPAMISAAQCAELRKLIKEADSSEVGFVDYLKCGTLPELPAERFVKAKKALTDRIARIAQDKKPAANPQADAVLEDEIPY